MAQPSVSSFFITRKRGIEEDVIASKKKVICLERFSNSENLGAGDADKTVVYPTTSTQGAKLGLSPAAGEKSAKAASVASMRQGITAQRTRSSRRVQMQNVDGIEAQKIATFFIGGSLSPQKKAKKQVEVPPPVVASAKQPEQVTNDGMKTPTKKIAPATTVEKTLLIASNSLSADELKKKLRGSTKLTELKTSLNKLRNGFDKLDQMERKRTTKAAAETPQSPSLKPFKNIELEILSPKKIFSSPIKLKDSPMKNTLIGSPKILSPRKLLFSPTKSPMKAPANAPAYERFQNLADSGTPSLQLPFKYRYILEVFKAVDTVCAMFFNRKEKITFKKMKPAVQRILRKNFFESHLAQINQLMPNAYAFAQEKTRNYGSTSKQDYYQLVITPNLKNDTDDLSQLTLSPQILIERTKKMTEKLIDLVYAEHEKFLQTLDVPMNVTRRALKRWHPEFPLESVPDVEQKQLPLPPNVERYSSAKDVLSTARNLFSCSTPMERALERLEAKKKEEKAKQVQNQEQYEAVVKATTSATGSARVEEKTKPTPDSSLLKGVPQSLLEKIRAKQAAKALDTMTRRPSQERDAAKYSRLPEIARHVRNVFVTEKKGVLPLDIVLTKIENSYKANASLKEIEELLRIIAKEMPRWISFHEIRNALFVRINRENDLADVIEKLQAIASQKAKI